MNSRQPFFLLSLVIALACGDPSDMNPDGPDSDSDSDSDSGAGADSFFRFGLVVGSDTLSIDVPCTFPLIPVPGTVQFSGDDEVQGYGIGLAWQEVDVTEPGVFEVRTVFHRFRNGGVNITSIPDAAVTIETLEDNRWAGTFDNWSFEVDAGTSPQTILVTEGSFDCRLDL